MLTFSEIASFALVGTVWTIGDVVAHGSHVDASSGDSRALPLTDWTSERWCNTSVLVRLVGVVAAVVFSVTNVGLEDALGIVTLEEVVRARYGSTVLLVGMIVAIVGAVAVPSNRNANAGGLTSEMLFLVALIGFHRGTAELVRAVVTIRYSVALVGLLDTLTQVSAFKLVR